jgi:hypothetical protein
MTGRLVVSPLPSRILLRSVGYGAGYGAVAGIAVAVLLAAFAAPYALGLLILAPIAATAGAIFGIACGLTGGVGLAIFRRQASTSLWTVRVVAGSGAGLLPAAWLVAGVISPGRSWHLGLALLTVVVVGLGAALGPSAFFGRPPHRARRVRRARRARPAG